MVSCLYILLRNFSVVGFARKFPVALALDIRDYQKPGLNPHCSKLAFPEISNSPGIKEPSSCCCTSVAFIFLNVSWVVCCLCLIQGQRHQNKQNVPEVEKNVKLLVQVEPHFFSRHQIDLSVTSGLKCSVLALHFWTKIFFLPWLMSAETKFQVKRPLQCYFRAEAILSLFSSFHFPDAILSLALGSPHRH